MEIKGKVVAVLPTQSGKGKNGNWTIQEVVLEVPGKYPKKVCLSLPKDKIGSVKQGQELTANINIESREYNGKYYTNVSAWKIAVNGDGVDAPAEDDDSGLPF